MMLDSQIPEKTAFFWETRAETKDLVLFLMERTLDIFLIATQKWAHVRKKTENWTFQSSFLLQCQSHSVAALSPKSALAHGNL